MDKDCRIDLLLDDEDIHFFVYEINEVGSYHFEYYVLSFRYIYLTEEYISDIDTIYHKELMNELIEKYKL